MILAVKGSSKNQCRTAIAAAATACSVLICQQDGDQSLIDSRPKHPDRLNQFDFPKYDEERKNFLGFDLKDEIIPEALKSPFVCANEAMLQFVENESFYAFRKAPSLKRESIEAFYRRMIPRLRALAANEEIIREFIKTAIDHFEKGTVAPPPFLEEASFRDLIHQYFKFSESKHNFLSKNDLLSEFGVATETELFEIPIPPENTDEELSQKLLIGALQQTLDWSQDRVLKSELNKCIRFRDYCYGKPSIFVPVHIRIMQKSICNLLCVCCIRNPGELTSKLNVKPMDDELHSFIDRITGGEWATFRAAYYSWTSCRDCVNLLVDSSDVWHPSMNQSIEVNDRVKSLSLSWSRHIHQDHPQPFNPAASAIGRAN